ncbi:hypothetical protein PIB30_098188 [Stylosanthes scabra]|uniref:Uncharacterized protein n=1 Tax=Stylosanthes scabra TaxID=79078 RepID=A0ABU6UZ77_9FABA|nr:hypothetical protein [Stylosanthes scabra]
MTPPPLNRASSSHRRKKTLASIRQLFNPRLHGRRPLRRLCSTTGFISIDDSLDKKLEVNFQDLLCCCRGGEAKEIRNSKMQALNTKVPIADGCFWKHVKMSCSEIKAKEESRVCVEAASHFSE